MRTFPYHNFLYNITKSIWATFTESTYPISERRGRSQRDLRNVSISQRAPSVKIIVKRCYKITGDYKQSYVDSYKFHTRGDEFWHFSSAIIFRNGATNGPLHLLQMIQTSSVKPLRKAVCTKVMKQTTSSNPRCDRKEKFEWCRVSRHDWAHSV